MTECCKNCSESICIKGLSGKIYLCRMNPTKKEENWGLKYKKVRPNSVCENYEKRGAKND